MSALLLACHNDDETLFSFYNLVRYQAHVVIVLRSFKEAALGGPTYQVREAETECAMNVAGVTWEQWPFSDLSPDWPKIRSRVRAEMERHEFVIAPAYEDDGHEQHNDLAMIVRQAGLVSTNTGPLIQYMTYVRGAGGRTMTANEVVPTDVERGQKLAALACYQSQLNYPPTRLWFGSEQREFVA